jgi:formate hydrogenlyase subunit 5
MLRVIHAELERIAKHLDVVMRLCDAAGIAVPTARFGWHKECVLRWVSAMCGNRFGRSVVCPGGINADLRLTPAEISDRTAAILHRIRSDRDALIVDASFLDRLRGTGPLDPVLAASHGALGPVGRGSGCDDDARRRAYDGYAEIPPAVDGFALGWAEAPQGEVLYGLEVREGVIGRCFARSASLHNMLLFHDVFQGDVFTDFPFIEASFGLCYAGVAM